MTRRLATSGLAMGERRRRKSNGFTLIELVIVIAIIGAMFAIVGFRTGTFAFWREEGIIRRLSETVVFLHHQSVTDQVFYRLEIDMSNPQQHSYRIGVLKTEKDALAAASSLLGGAGMLSLELANFLSPSIDDGATVLPPPAFPSLAEPVKLPEGMLFEDVRTMRGKLSASEGGKPFILFSPRGFSEFAVLHLRMNSGQQITILINPFTGTTEIYREYKDFQWTYGLKKEGA